MTRLCSTTLLMFLGATLAFAPCGHARQQPAGSGREAAPEADQVLHRLRAQRRQQVRQRSQSFTDKKMAAGFGLLVIPVDFQDLRFGESFDGATLADRIFGPGGSSLANFFHVASVGRMELHPLVAPVVHLKQDRAQYSDIGWAGFSRTRLLAYESLTALAELGLSFAELDDDGPDGLPGSGDDDGLVDGVLILHAGPGQENDPQTGLIQPLQYFLAEPVYQGGVGASFYAVASMSSGPGIWAHETGHLLGMEDRYDYSLPAGGLSDVVSRGGLGIFSLMSAGAWGTGGGQGATLPDAFTRLELGWVSVEDLAPYRTGTVTLFPPVEGGSVARLFVPGTDGHEYFLMECRSSPNAAPFDAMLPPDQLLVYHVDENLAEGTSTADQVAGRHLRVSLVEADGDRALLEGLNTGSADDMFPGSLGKDLLPAAGYPGLMGYAGNAGIALSNIATSTAGVSFDVEPGAPPGLTFTFGLDPARTALELTATATGVPLEQLSCTVEVTATTWGSFADGQKTVSLILEDDGQGTYRPASVPPWFGAASIPEGASTDFLFHFSGAGGFALEAQRTWLWTNAPGVLDFGGDWPGSWTISYPEGNEGTTWHRWPSSAALTADGGPVLACTGEEFSSGVAWPEVHYGNRGHTVLSSGALGADVRAVRVIHAIEVEYLNGDVVMDGGRILWRGPDGGIIPGEPVGGYPARVSPKAANPLLGQDVFACDTLSLRDDRLVWQADVIPVPATVSGPWRLELEFGSNSLWRRRGWFIASITPLESGDSQEPFAVHWERDGNGPRRLVWTWPWPMALPDQWLVQNFDVLSRTWVDVGELPPDAYHGVEESRLPAATSGSAGSIRILGLGPVGWLATRGVSLGEEPLPGGPGPLGMPWPNPGTAPIRVSLDLEAGFSGRLVIYDVRGRQVRSQPVTGGQSLMLWDGCDDQGQRAGAGLYILKLEGYPGPGTRKVVLLR